MGPSYGSGELLDKILRGGSPKKARIPLPQPSLSLCSTTSSIQTEYCNQESDLRDEINHDADVSMDSMREGANDVSQLTSLIGQEQLSNSENTAIDETDKMNSEIVNSLSMESLKSVSSSMLYTALEGTVLWSIMNHETAVLPDLTPRVASAVAELEEEEDSIFAQLDTKSTDTCLKTSSSLTTAKAGNTRSRKRNGIISDNSISTEMSYSGFMDASNKEKVIRDSRSSSTNDPTPAPARKQVKWSSKILGRTGGQMKRVKTKSILKRFKKKKNCKMEEQNKLGLLVEESTEEENGREIKCVIDETIEKYSVEDTNKTIEANNEKEDTEETKEIEIQPEAAADEPSINPVVLDKPAVPASPALMCNLQEVKEAIFAIVAHNPEG